MGSCQLSSTDDIGSDLLATLYPKRQLDKQRGLRRMKRCVPSFREIVQVPVPV